MDEKTIIRISKNKDNPYVMIDKRIAEDARLSWKAKGLMLYFLSRPDTWTIRMGDLINRSTDGEASIRAGINELVEAGYIVRRETHDERGYFVKWLEVYEQPGDEITDATSDFPREEISTTTSDFPRVDFPRVENRALNNIKLSNNDLTNIVNVVNGENSKNFFSIYEHEIGILSPYIAERLKELEGEYPEDWFVQACKIAATQNKRTLAYVIGILKNWKINGYGAKPGGNKPGGSPAKYDELDAIINGGR